MRLEGKTAWMAGVGTGMGRAAAVLFAQEGAHVVITARGRGDLEETAARIRDAGGSVSVMPGDLTDGSEAGRIADAIAASRGRIDIAYCAAGGSFEPARGFADVDEEFWSGAISNTLNSLYNVAQRCRPVMKAQGGGSIVAVAASFSVRQEGNPAYGAAKGGVIGLRPQPGAGALPGQHPGQRHRRRAVQSAHSRRPPIPRPHNPGPDRPPRGHSLCSGLPRLRRGILGHRPSAIRGRRRGRRRARNMGARGIGSQLPDNLCRYCVKSSLVTSSGGTS